MTYYLTYIKDTIGNNYIGINIPNGVVQPFLNELKYIVGENDYDEFVSYQQKRDHGSYHMTVINVMDYNKLSKEIGMDKFINSLEPIFKYELDDVKMLGLGTAERSGNRAYFVVCQSDSLDAVRTRFNLPKHDFHITLGFNAKKEETKNVISFLIFKSLMDDNTNLQSLKNLFSGALVSGITSYICNGSMPEGYSDWKKGIY